MRKSYYREAVSLNENMRKMRKKVADCRMQKVLTFKNQFKKMGRSRAWGQIAAKTCQRMWTSSLHLLHRDGITSIHTGGYTHTHTHPQPHPLTPTPTHTQIYWDTTFYCPLLLSLHDSKIKTIFKFTTTNTSKKEKKLCVFSYSMSKWVRLYL